MKKLLTDNHKSQLETALQSGDGALLRAIPKADLHSHFYLSAPMSAHKTIINPPPKRFDDLYQFFGWIRENIPGTNDPSEFERIYRETIKSMTRNGVRYAEISAHPQQANQLGLSFGEWAKLIENILGDYSEQIAINVELGIGREYDLTESSELLDRAIDHPNVFKGIDLYGDEAKPVANYKPLFQRAKKNGLKLKAHVGEIGTAKEIVEAVETLELDAVQHGIAAAQDQYTMDFLKERQIILNTCITSNYALRVSDSLENHPIKTLVRNGVKVSINTDDFSIFDSSICDEILIAHQIVKLSADEIFQIIKSSLDQERDTSKACN